MKGINMANEQITREEVEHVASLAKLALTDAEADMFTDHLGKIFDIVIFLSGAFLVFFMIEPVQKYLNK